MSTMVLTGSMNQGLKPEILALTPQWLVVFKPAGWLTIPGREPVQNIGILSEWATQLHGKIWIVHRLDRETSGIVLFARTAEDHRLANSWFQKHQVKKIYHCLAQGIPSAPVFKISLPVLGAPSLTQVEVKESFQEGFLAHIRIVTGRRHQIRIHLSQTGHPLWGDLEYQGTAQIGEGEKKLRVTRVALHAAKLELPTKEVFEAQWPEDFREWVEWLRREGHHV